jgi:hypothetical protein
MKLQTSLFPAGIQTGYTRMQVMVLKHKINKQASVELEVHARIM